MNAQLKMFLAPGCCIGLMPIVPGSFGALSGLGWHLILWLLPIGEIWLRVGCLAGVFLFSMIHYWLTSWVQSHWHDSDLKNFAMDAISWVRTVWRTIVNLWLKPQFLGVSHMTVAKS